MIKSIMLPPVGDKAAADFLQQISDLQSMHPSRSLVFHIFRLAGDLCVQLAVGHISTIGLKSAIPTATQASYFLAL
jgi:hypothetical protein